MLALSHQDTDMPVRHTLSFRSSSAEESHCIHDKLLPQRFTLTPFHSINKSNSSSLVCASRGYICSLSTVTYEGWWPSRMSGPSLRGKTTHQFPPKKPRSSLGALVLWQCTPSAPPESPESFLCLPMWPQQWHRWPPDFWSSSVWMASQQPRSNNSSIHFLFTILKKKKKEKLLSQVDRKIKRQKAPIHRFSSHMSTTSQDWASPNKKLGTQCMSSTWVTGT